MNLGDGKVMRLPCKPWQLSRVYAEAMDRLGIGKDARLHTLGRNVYKAYYWLYMQGYQPMNSKIGYGRNDNSEEYTHKGIARAIGCSDTVMVITMTRLYQSGFAVKRMHGREHRGGFLYFPELKGCDYAEVDVRKALACFAYGAPIDAWGVYLIAHNIELSFPADNFERDLGYALLHTAKFDEVSFALDWLLYKKMIQKRRGWKGDEERVVLDVLV